MNNFGKTLELMEGVKAPRTDKKYSQDEAADYFDVSKDKVIYSERIVKGTGVWINDDTSECVYAKERAKDVVGYKPQAKYS